MKLKVPPVVVLFVFALAMYFLAKYLPVGYFDFFGRLELVKILLVIMILILILSLCKFFKAKASINPLKPEKTEVLVTSGIYKYTRNPMYLAMLILLLAWALHLGNAFNVLLAAGFVSYMNVYQIIPEEKTLADKFGKNYRLYCKKVRRWF